ncbi:MAG TPA: hypothetical protein VFD27_19060 [Chthoniobacteraceae bacterium]|jgi:hypothetical protein|nr:hypothetical protein [Chthoniobacteraceae bacterium]
MQRRLPDRRGIQQMRPDQREAVAENLRDQISLDIRERLLEACTSASTCSCVIVGGGGGAAADAGCANPTDDRAKGDGAWNPLV